MSNTVQESNYDVMIQAVRY